MAFAYAGTLRTSVEGGTVTQNRAAVDTRTASNSPKVAANNDDFSLVEDDNPPTGSTRSSVGTHEPFVQRGPDWTSDVSITPTTTSSLWLRTTTLQLDRPSVGTHEPFNVAPTGQVMSPSRLGPTNATGLVESAQFPTPRSAAREPSPRLRQLTIDPRLMELTINRPSLR
jgi:hypothetical protein